MASAQRWVTERMGRHLLCVVHLVGLLTARPDSGDMVASTLSIDMSSLTQAKWLLFCTEYCFGHC